MKEFFSGKRILVTGAGGFIASRLTEALKEVDCTIIRLSRKKDLPEPGGRARVKDAAGDIRRRETWEKVLPGIDIVYHFAGQTSAYFAEDNQLADYEINVLPMQLMLDVCRKGKHKPAIVFSGTVTVAGITKEVPVNEDRADDPVTIYDLHNIMAENYLKYYSDKGFIAGVSIRLPNVYGPGPKSGSADRGILNLMMRRALNGEDLTIYGQGDSIRDYIYISDVVNAFLSAAVKVEKLKGKHFIIGSGRGYTIAAAINLIADRVKKLGRPRPAVKHVEPPAGMHDIEYRNFTADTRRFSEVSGWRPFYMLEKGIDETIESFLISNTGEIK
ncbi:MAG: NAD-dependent epimerase/dehydratase family protein [Candidatus Aminicenantes bacterium]|nr:NAD-dependent epimerase/dehydratase family protein [Candidatus Aminicenantes bacterium]